MPPIRARVLFPKLKAPPTLENYYALETKQIVTITIRPATN